jgi:putative ATP-dependent endonuclease of the OLD family
LYDKPNVPLAQEAIDKLKGYTRVRESPEKGIENVLIKQTPIAVVRRFLNEVKGRLDYPAAVGTYDPAAGDADVAALAVKVLKARKGDAHGYAAMLVSHCQKASELPGTIREILETIHKALTAVPEDIVAAPPDDIEDLFG